MSDYLPLYLPGNAVTGTASAAIVGGKAVKVSGDGTIATAAAAADLIIGVAGFDVAASGDKVTYFARGTIHRLTAAGGITAGQVVEGAAAGAVATHTQGTNDVRVFGVALTTALDTALVEVMEF
jgi:hypothetical protein